MALVLTLAAGLWVLGHLFKVPVRGRVLMVAILYVAVLMLHVSLPANHPLRLATGGSAGEWLVVGGLGQRVPSGAGQDAARVLEVLGQQLLARGRPGPGAHPGRASGPAGAARGPRAHGAAAGTGPG